MELTLETIRAAHARIAPYIVQTPLLRLPALDDAIGCEVYAKAECMQRTGAFKLRGAMNKILALTEDERARGFVAASSGNHGRAVAYAAQRFGTHACIVMPETAPAVKQAAIRALGAELVLCDAAERFDVAARLCAERGATMVPPFDDPLVMAGQGTVGLEILEQCAAALSGEPARRASGAGGAAALGRGRARRAKAGGCVFSICGRKHRRLCARGGCRPSARHEAAASGGQAPVRAVVRHRHGRCAVRAAAVAQDRQGLLCHQRRQCRARAAAPA